VLLFMEDLWKLGPLFIFGDHICLEEGAHSSRHELDLRDCQFVGLIGEVAHNSTLWCKGFFFGATSVKGASLE
jgi:hypothetical protein